MLSLGPRLQGPGEKAGQLAGGQRTALAGGDHLVRRHLLQEFYGESRLIFRDLEPFVLLGEKSGAAVDPHQLQRHLVEVCYVTPA